jgi:hypothetical protein
VPDQRTVTERDVVTQLTTGKNIFFQKSKHQYLVVIVQRAGAALSAQAA